MEQRLLIAYAILGLVALFVTALLLGMRLRRRRDRRKSREPIDLFRN